MGPPRPRATEDPDGFFHIISGDTGFDQMIKHLKG
jgi:hypothetical protein